MSDFSRSAFLRLATLGPLGFAASRALALPPDYTGLPAGIAPYPGVIRPYLHAMTPDSVWISWFTANETSGSVEWGASPASLSNSLAATTDTSLGEGYRYHIAKITGLSPSTFYHYRVKNGSNASQVFRFRTPPPNGTKSGILRVLVTGDNQTYTPERRHEKLIACAKYKIEQIYGVPIEEAIDFMLTTGDQVDRGKMLHYRDLHFGFNGRISPYLPIMTTVGNHELYDDPSLTFYRKLFRYPDINYAGIASPDPEIYYAYKVANICFIHTSSEPEHTGSAQTNWLRQVVDTLKTDPGTDLCVSLAHRPYRAAQAIGDTSAWLANTIMPMLAETEKHVLTISGHHHYYDRGQTRDWPIYHMISGGTASFQSWSGFNYNPAAPYDEVQKTYFNWAWQILEFDLANRTMEVRSFTETNGNWPEATRWTTQGYNSRLIDSFHRRLGLAAPAKPALSNPFVAPLNHPVSLISTPFATSTGEVLNSTWFQVATDASFSNLKLNRIRDVENFYGDTGAPNFEPVDVNNRMDILSCAIPTTLPAGTYHARVRHRDTNVMWSPWSDTQTLTITNGVSGAPGISVPQSIRAPGDTVTVTYGNSPAGAWIGICPKGTVPGPTTIAASQPTGGTSGSRVFAGTLPTGEWFAALFGAGGYSELALRVPFYVGTSATLAPAKGTHAEGEAVRLDYANSPAGAKDWIGIYQIGQNPGTNGCQSWQYAAAASGSIEFINIPKGYYFAVLMINDGYQEISARARFSVGTQITQLTLPAKVAQGDSFTVNFAKGPGLANDWIGLYRDGDVPGQSTPVHRIYANGAANGQITFNLPGLAAGRYWVAMFTDDSFTEVSSRFYFDLVPLVCEESQLENGTMRLRWKSVPGESYTVQKSAALAPDTWTDAQTLTATGDTLETTVPIDANSRRGFFRIRRN